MKPAMAMYRSIALDLAQRMINGDFKEGDKFSGRSLLASHYNVSPETIRKAIAMLAEKDVVSVSQGKEVIFLSVEKAYQFIEHHKSAETVYSLRQDVELLLRQKQEIDTKLENLLTDIINYSDRLRNLTPYNPVEIDVPRHSHIVGKAISEIRLWQHTGATIVAIRRGTGMMISPGPGAVMEADDRLVVVGSSEVRQKTLDFIQGASRSNASS